MVGGIFSYLVFISCSDKDGTNSWLKIYIGFTFEKKIIHGGNFNVFFSTLRRLLRILKERMKTKMKGYFFIIYLFVLRITISHIPMLFLASRSHLSDVRLLHPKYLPEQWISFWRSF